MEKWIKEYMGVEAFLYFWFVLILFSMMAVLR